MFKRSTIALATLLAAALLLTACSNSSDNADSTAPAAPSPAAAPTPAPAAPASDSAANAASSATPAAVSSTPAPATSVAKATAPVTPTKPFVEDPKWVEGKNYFLIEPTQPKVSGTNKIEVVEAFSYGCPACFQAHAFIDKLEASLPNDAVMVYLPVAFRPDENWPVYQRAYYTAKALGIADKTHDAMFDATWKTGETATYDLASGKPKPQDQWPTIETMAKFYSKYGVNEAEFLAVSKSFSVDTKMKRADELVKSYQVGGTPTIIINGKYRFDGVSAGTYPNMIELAQYLVAKERAGK